MKKINSYHVFGAAVSGIILTILLLLSMRTTAQTVNSIPLKDIKAEYIQIVGTTGLMSAKLTIEIDFGQMSNIWRAKDNVILDENGKSMKFNVQILPMVGISRHYCSTTAQKLNSSTNAQLWHVCPTIGNILLAAVKF